jgi:hypothetical protein
MKKKTTIRIDAAIFEAFKQYCLARDYNISASIEKYMEVLAYGKTDKEGVVEARDMRLQYAQGNKQKLLNYKKTLIRSFNLVSKKKSKKSFKNNAIGGKK